LVREWDVEIVDVESCALAYFDLANLKKKKKKNGEKKDPMDVIFGRVHTFQGRKRAKSKPTNMPTVRASGVGMRLK
jgi:hypothetical protein